MSVRISLNPPALSARLSNATGALPDEPAGVVRSPYFSAIILFACAMIWLNS